MPIVIGTNKPLRNDERARSLLEGDEITPDGRDIHRVQTVKVIRDGEMVKFRLSLGPAKNFTAGPIFILSMEEHSVGEVLAMADALRENSGLDRAMENHRNQGDLIAGIVAQEEMVRAFAKSHPRTMQEIRSRKVK